MLFHVEMIVNIPPNEDADRIAELKQAEKTRSQELQREGIWRHIWRVVGQYANVSIFDVESHGHLHEILSELPLFPFMKIQVTPLCRHPSSIHADER